jgi:hypothetical protein
MTSFRKLWTAFVDALKPQCCARHPVALHSIYVDTRPFNISSGALMLLRNDLLHYTHPSPRTVRILWIAPEQGHAYVFDVAARSAEVELVPLPVLLADIRPATPACWRPILI